MATPARRHRADDTYHRRNLEELARGLASAADLPGILGRIAELALAAAHADSAYLERIDLTGDEVEVVGTAGEAGPAAGARLPYPGSLAQEAVEKDRAAIVTPAEFNRRPIGALLREAGCADCAALVMPLISEGDALGALILLRRPLAAPFTEAELPQLRLLADMAALALRRALTEHEARSRLAALEESEGRFRLLVESVRDYAIFMLDTEGRITSWNQGAERIKGYREEDILGRHFSVFYTPEDAAAGLPDRLLAEAARAGSVESQGWRVRSDGQRFWASVVITAIRDAAGALVGYAKVSRDLTERRQAEEEHAAALSAARQTSDRLTSTLESITDAFLTLDRDWRFTYVNRRAEEILQRQRSELLGRNVWQEFPDAVGSAFQRAYEHAVATGETAEFEEYYAPLGAWLEVRAYPSPQGLSVYFHDVTARRRAAQEVRERERQLRAVLEVLPLPVFIAEADGRLSEVNPAFLAFWGDAAAHPESTDDYGQFRGWWPDTGRRVKAEEWGLARALRQGEIVGPEEMQVETFTGERRTILNYARPIRDGDGRISGGVALQVDITERKTREEMERFLADAGRTLSGSLEYETTLREVARLAVSHIADWCIVYMPVHGEVERLAVAARDPDLERLALDMADRFPPTAGNPVHRVLRTGEPLLLPEVTDDMLVAAASDADALELLRRIGLRSYMLVPLVVRDEVAGAIAFGSAESGRRYGDDDLALAARLADRAAVAIENARIYRDAQRRAREEGALREAAAAVASAFTIDEVLDRIAASALVATQADGAFVERIAEAGRSVELAASAGSRVPTDTSRAPYTGSVAQEALERGEPLLIENAGVSESRILRGVAEACGPCSAMAIPLENAGEPIGALILVRAQDAPPFREDEIARARTFGELASLAFRKIHLLEESERRREELEAVTDSRAALIRGFSHDLKNPLGAADGYLSLMEEEIQGSLAPEQRESVLRVRRLLRAALELIEDLVELNRSETGQIQLKPVQVHVGEAARELAEQYRAQAEARGLRLHVDVPDALPIIQSDPTRVRQILGNLISNAVKYTEHGSITVTAGVRASADPGSGECLAVDVSDTGQGIPPDQQHLLFREFTRLNPHAGKGAGLGLAISQRIARALGGRITFASNAGPGSTFTLWLPLPAGRDG
jgi:PAS domain S-box-containing protein